MHPDPSGSHPEHLDAALLAAVAGLADTAAADAATDDLLRRLVEVAVEHLGVDGAGVVAAGSAGPGDLRLVHVSTGGPEAPERLQEQLTEGPCQDAALFGVDVVVDDLLDPVQTAWPAYVDAAVAAGWRSVVAVPLLSGGRLGGVLDVYRRVPGRGGRANCTGCGSWGTSPRRTWRWRRTGTRRGGRGRSSSTPAPTMR